MRDCFPEDQNSTRGFATVPKSLQYKTGSLIYAQGEKAEKIMLLHTGKAILAYDDIETGKDVRDALQPGDFFGVKSALGRYPREENAIALSDATILALTVPEFEAMALSNTRIVMKMLKVFSTQLRRVHTQISSLTESVSVNPEEGLFSVGERYMRLKRHSQAQYVFTRYLTYYPKGSKADQARKNLNLVDVALSLVSKNPEPEPPKAEEPDAPETSDAPKEST
jgi:CRP-like cAMP-binding protein